MQVQAGTETLDLEGLEALIFDLDGTLVESEHVWAAAKSEVARLHGLSPTEADLAGFVGRRATAFAAEYLGLTDAARRAEAVDQINEIAMPRLPTELRAIPGAADLVESARAAGLRIAICSSAPMSAIRTALEVLGLADMVEATVSADGMSRGKPHRQPYVETLRMLGLRPEQALAFEDSPSGIQAATAAGIPTIALGPHPAGRADTLVLAICGSVAEVTLT